MFEHSGVRNSIAGICEERKITLEQHLSYIDDGLSVQIGLYHIYPFKDIHSQSFQGKYAKYIDLGRELRNSGRSKKERFGVHPVRNLVQMSQINMKW